MIPTIVQQMQSAAAIQPQETRRSREEIVRLMEERRARIAALLTKLGAKTPREISDHINVSLETIYDDTKALQAAGMVKFINRSNRRVVEIVRTAGMAA